MYEHDTTHSECHKDVRTWHIAFYIFSLQTCRVVLPTQLLCMIPELTTVTSGASLDYSLTFDGQVLSSLSSVQPLRAVADPVFNGSSPTQYAENSNLLLTISVSIPGLHLCLKLDIAYVRYAVEHQRNVHYHNHFYEIYVLKVCTYIYTCNLSMYPIIIVQITMYII